MGLLRKLFNGKREPEKPVTPGEMLDALEMDRDRVEQLMLERYDACPECERKQDYLRLGAWTKNGEAGWTVTCINCGHLLVRTTEVSG